MMENKTKWLPWKQKEWSLKKELFEWAKSLAIALVFVMIIRTFIGLPYLVVGDSMTPNFHDGDRVLVNKLIYFIQSPQKGEVVVAFSPHPMVNKDLIKRVIATAGDKVEVKGDVVCINDVCSEEDYLRVSIALAKLNQDSYNHLDFAPAVVPEGHVFAMGDNRSFSLDSRSPEVGMIPLSDVKGRVDVRFWPLKDASLLF